MKSKLLSLVAIAGGCVAALPAYAVCGSPGTTVTCEGVSYQLFETKTANPLTDDFTLSITGINSSSTAAYDGRSGVQSFAFGNIDSPTTATAPTGFTYMSGGLNSGGCDGSGAFFCFYANTTPATTPALAAGSSLSYSFSVTADNSADFLSWQPGFKINWIGTQNNYNLVSQTLTPTPTRAPEIDPASASAAVSLLAGGLAILRGRRRKA
jgi:hypothetical protein